MHASIRLALSALGVSVITLAASGAPLRLPDFKTHKPAAPAPALRIEAAPISHSSFKHEAPDHEPAPQTTVNFKRRLTDA